MTPPQSPASLGQLGQAFGTRSWECNMGSYAQNTPKRKALRKVTFFTSLKAKIFRTNIGGGRLSLHTTTLDGIPVQHDPLCTIMSDSEYRVKNSSKVLFRCGPNHGVNGTRF